MNKIVLITGAAKGIGYETALQLGKKGYTVIVTARSQEKSDETVAKLKAMGIDAYSFKLEVTSTDDINRAFDFVARKFGKLDVLVNNAGIQLDNYEFVQGNSTETVSQDILKETFNSNFFGPIALTQKMLPLIRKSDAGRIVNVSSVLGSLALHSNANSPIYNTKMLAYNSSKTALNQFTLHLAAALKDTNIKVNSAHPGWVKTDLGGEHAPLSVEQGAKTIVDLCQAEENGTTGGFIHLGEAVPW